ncbi:MAG: hypothetical protein QM767_11595 [Anaeromyxobacter sp.]
MSRQNKRSREQQLKQLFPASWSAMLAASEALRTNRDPEAAVPKLRELAREILAFTDPLKRA